jgi:glycosyltransferase involved in cell wall biosynthesis
VAGSVTAVLLRFWPERDENLPVIIADLQASTRPPDRIMVVDQGPDPRPVFEPGVEVVRLPRNYRTRARYVAALLNLSDWFVFIDDDITVCPGTIELLLEHARPGRVITVRGVYGDIYQGEPLPDDRPRPCDWVVGRVHAAHWRAIVRMLEVEERFRLGHPDVDCADMVLGRVNDCVSIPAPFRDLASHGVGLDQADDYSEVRDRAVARLAEVGL